MRRLLLVLATGALAFSGSVIGEDAKESGKAVKADTLVVTARVVEIPGTFPPNDLYNYVYIMKYRILKTHKGKFSGKEILIGHYNPLIARAEIKDKMAKCVDGDVEKFEEGAKHKMVLVKPISAVWQEAIEDEYFDEEVDKYYALKTDMAK